MDQDNSDISLNIFSSPVDVNTVFQSEARGKKRKRNTDDLTSDILSQTTENIRSAKKSAKSSFLVPRQKEGKALDVPVAIDEDGDGIEGEFEGYQGRNKPNTSSAGKTSSLFGNNPEIPSFARRVVKPVIESVFTLDDFKDLDIHPFAVSNLEQNLSVTKLTTIQQKTIPAIMSGDDVLVRSQTGSGKTLAYALPIVEALQKIRPKLPRAAGIQAVVVVPTRELALQTYEWFVKLVKPFTWLVPGYLVGGEKRKSEKARLRKGITILIGTPGRILDHVKNTKSMLMDRVRWLVLDEADRLLDMGYEKDVASLVSSIDSQAEENPDTLNRNEFGEPRVVRRQTILVSATLTNAVERLAGLALNAPTHIDAAADSVGTKMTRASRTDPKDDKEVDHSIPESLMQYYMITPAKLRLVTLAGFIISKCQFSDKRKMLVFMATQDMVDFHTELLSSVLGTSVNKDDDDDEYDEEDGVVDVEFFKLHGNMTQKDRTECFKTFREAKSGVLVCTDVAARGLDLPHVDWIVQYTGPCSVADYVHRVGRTARVGVAGSAVLFLATTEVDFVRKLEDRRIRLQEEAMEKNLQSLQVFNQPTRGKNKNFNPTLEASATALQLRFENAVLERKRLHGLAVKEKNPILVNLSNTGPVNNNTLNAYISFVRFYASYPKEGRDVFSFKNLHLGHYAKCFALRDPPSSIGGIGRRKWQDDGEQRSQKQKYTTSGPNKGRTLQQQRAPTSGISRARELVTSEYASGLPERKKKKTTMT